MASPHADYLGAIAVTMLNGFRVLRISEALGLDWSDVEFGEQPMLHVRRQHYRGETKRLKSPAGRRDLPLSPGDGTPAVGD